MQPDPSHVTQATPLTVVLPVYRNEASVAELVTRLEQACTPLNIELELLFVDDASPDNAHEIIQNLKSHHPTIRIIRHDHNRGQQEAIRTGLKNSNSDYVAVMDADLQDPPEIIPSLYQELVDRQVNAVFAVRSNPYQSTGRMNTSKAFKWLVRQMVNLPKGAGCFVLMDRAMVRAVLGFQTKRFYLPGLICKAKLTISTLEFEREQRIHGTSSYTSAMRLKTALSNIKCLLE